MNAPPSIAADLVQQGRPADALAALTQDIRARPGDSRLRVFMAQLLCVLGQWQRALTQLDVAAEQDALAEAAAQQAATAAPGPVARAAVPGWM